MVVIAVCVIGWAYALIATWCALDAQRLAREAQDGWDQCVRALRDKNIEVSQEHAMRLDCQKDMEAIDKLMDLAKGKAAKWRK